MRTYWCNKSWVLVSCLSFDFDHGHALSVSCSLHLVFFVHLIVFGALKIFAFVSISSAFRDDNNFYEVQELLAQGHKAL